jgi:hypothetical protein
MPEKTDENVNKSEKDEFSFSAPLNKAYTDDNDEMHVIAVVSDTSEDREDDKVSKDGLEHMAEQIKEKEVGIKDYHETAFSFGEAVDARVIEVEKDERTYHALEVDFLLDSQWPQSQALYQEVAEGDCDKQLSIGGEIDRSDPGAIRYVVERGSRKRVIDRINLDHIAATPAGLAANEGTYFVDAVMKTLDENEQTEQINVEEDGLKSEALAETLNEVIDEMLDNNEDLDKEDVVSDMADSAGIEDSTVRAILANDINCPPRRRLEGFSEVLNIDVDDLISRAESDGCDYSNSENNSLLSDFEEDVINDFKGQIALPIVDDGNAVVAYAELPSTDVSEFDESDLKFYEIEGNVTDHIENIALDGINNLTSTVNEDESSHEIDVDDIRNIDFTDEQKSEIMDILQSDTELQSNVQFESFPRVSEDEPWNGFDQASDGNKLLVKGSDADDMEEFYDLDPEDQHAGWKMYKKAHAWFNPDGAEKSDFEDAPHNKNSYGLAHHKIVDGEIKTFLSGVISAMATLNGANDGFPQAKSADELKSAYNHLAKHYNEFDREAPEFSPPQERMSMEDFMKKHDGINHQILKDDEWRNELMDDVELSDKLELADFVPENPDDYSETQSEDWSGFDWEDFRPALAEAQDVDLEDVPELFVDLSVERKRWVAQRHAIVRGDEITEETEYSDLALEHHQPMGDVDRAGIIAARQRLRQTDASQDALLEADMHLTNHLINDFGEDDTEPIFEENMSQYLKDMVSKMDHEKLNTGIKVLGRLSEIADQFSGLYTEEDKEKMEVRDEVDEKINQLHEIMNSKDLARISEAKEIRDELHDIELNEKELNRLQSISEDEDDSEVEANDDDLEREHRPEDCGENEVWDEEREMCVPEDREMSKEEKFSSEIADKIDESQSDILETYDEEADNFDFESNNILSLDEENLEDVGDTPEWTDGQIVRWQVEPDLMGMIVHVDEDRKVVMVEIMVPNEDDQLVSTGFTITAGYTDIVPVDMDEEMQDKISEFESDFDIDLKNTEKGDDSMDTEEKINELSEKVETVAEAVNSIDERITAQEEAQSSSDEDLEAEEESDSDEDLEAEDESSEDSDEDLEAEDSDDSDEELEAEDESSEESDEDLEAEESDESDEDLEAEESEDTESDDEDFEASEEVDESDEDLEAEDESSEDSDEQLESQDESDDSDEDLEAEESDESDEDLEAEEDKQSEAISELSEKIDQVVDAVSSIDDRVNKLEDTSLPRQGKPAGEEVSKSGKDGNVFSGTIFGDS